MNLNNIIQEVIDYQTFRGLDSEMSFTQYYFTIHHPLYNGYYHDQCLETGYFTHERLQDMIDQHFEWQFEIERGK